MVRALCPSCRGFTRKMRNCDTCGGTGWIELKNKFADIDPVDDTDVKRSSGDDKRD